jgi:ribonuclease HI
MSHKSTEQPQNWALYTDGSSDSRDKSGGWAWVAFDAYQGEMSDSGGIMGTTNNRMEMTAWIEGLQELFLLFGACRVIVYSDSEYVGLGAMDRGRHRNKNNDLWKQLDQIIDNHLYVEFNHVKGHKDDVVNNIVDVMAGNARKQYRDEHKAYEPSPIA